METKKVRVNRALSEMRKDAAGRVVGDSGLKVEDIHRHSGVPLDIVRVVLRHKKVPDHADGAELLKLLRYFLGGAAKKNTPLEHHTLLAQNAATIQGVLDARRDEELRRAETLAPRLFAPAAAARGPATQGALRAPDSRKGAHLSAPSAVERAWKSLDIAKQWISLRKSELALLPEASPSARTEWVRRALAEGDDHRNALGLTKHVHGTEGGGVRIETRRSVKDLEALLADVEAASST